MVEHSGKYHKSIQNSLMDHIPPLSKIHLFYGFSMGKSQFEKFYTQIHYFSEFIKK